MTKEEAINTIQELMKACAPYSKYYIVGDMAIKALEQEPRKGKWTKISNTVPCMNCPICGSTFTLIQGGNKMHYCPNCGAEMESEAEE